jgi:hypothetical protein
MILRAVIRAFHWLRPTRRAVATARASGRRSMLRRLESENEFFRATW